MIGVYYISMKSVKLDDPAPFLSWRFDLVMAGSTQLYPQLRLLPASYYGI